MYEIYIKNKEQKTKNKTKKKKRKFRFLFTSYDKKNRILYFFI